MEKDVVGEWIQFRNLSGRQIEEITSAKLGDYGSAFYGDPALKERFLERAARHKEADQIHHGLYWESYTKTNADGEYVRDERGNIAVDFHGCAVGCLSHATEQAHVVLSRMTNVPKAIYHLTDTLFEDYDLRGHFPPLDLDLPGDVIRAIPVGSDQSDTHYRVISRILRASAPDDLNLSPEQVQDILTVLENPAKSAAEKYMTLQRHCDFTYSLTDGLVTWFWEKMIQSVGAVRAREILLEELRNAPVPETVIATPEGQQLLSEFMTDVVTVHEKVEVV